MKSYIICTEIPFLKRVLQNSYALSLLKESFLEAQHEKVKDCGVHCHFKVHSREQEMRNLLPSRCRLPPVHEVYAWVMGKVGREHCLSVASPCENIGSVWEPDMGRHPIKSCRGHKGNYTIPVCPRKCCAWLLWFIRHLELTFFPSIFQWDFSIALLGASEHIHPESYALHTDLVCIALEAGSCGAL